MKIENILKTLSEKEITAFTELLFKDCTYTRLAISRNDMRSLKLFINDEIATSEKKTWKPDAIQ